jgi:hypothetical protein
MLSEAVFVVSGLYQILDVLKNRVLNVILFDLYRLTQFVDIGADVLVAVINPPLLVVLLSPLEVIATVDAFNLAGKEVLCTDAECSSAEASSFSNRLCCLEKSLVNNGFVGVFDNDSFLNFV